MRFPLHRRHLLRPPPPHLPSMALLTTATTTVAHPDDLLCSPSPPPPTTVETTAADDENATVVHPNGYLPGEAHIERAWAHWTKLGRPKTVVAPMVDCSELPFRMLCRKYGAQAAYTPMLHARLFSECDKYRSTEFSTCKEDRPLFVQFCANDPDILLEAARHVESICDYVDINLGCPQRIAKRGNYGAFLMDNLPLVRSLVEKLARNLRVPVSCKIRLFPNSQDTISYAKMLEEAGCSLLAVHGRTRDQKDQRKIRADWAKIKEVRNAIRIPVLANGNVRHMDDVDSCLEATDCEGVLSADALLENPALFAGFRTPEWAVDGEDGTIDGKLDQAELLTEYLKFCETYPVPWRMVRAHVHKMLGEWFRLQPQVREELNGQYKLTFEYLHGVVDQLRQLGVSIPLHMKDDSSSVKMAAENGDHPLSIGM